MKRRRTPSVQEDVVCNLIPMVDIMFLLLLFFMLSADMSQRELEDLVLPTGDQVKENPAEKPIGVKSATINIFHKAEGNGFYCATNHSNGICRDLTHWLIAIRGNHFTFDTVGAKLKELADDALEPTTDAQAGRRLSALEVAIRADRAAPYGYIQKMIELCSLAGIYKIEVGAAQPPKG